MHICTDAGMLSSHQNLNLCSRFHCRKLQTKIDLCLWVSHTLHYAKTRYLWGTSKGALKCRRKPCLVLDEFSLGIILPQSFQFSQPLWGGFLVGLKPWRIPLCHVSPYIPKFGNRGPPVCLCAADTQAKQEETGDSHWGLRVHTGISVHSRWRSGLSEYHKGQTHVSDYIGQDNVGSYLPLWGRVCPHASALRACLNLLCGNQCAVQPNLTTQAEGRRYNVHAELLRQKNKYEKRKGSLLEVRGAAGRRCETGKPSCFRNLNAPLLRTSNMCLYEGAITQFQDLAFCINIDQHNLTHCSDDVRLISIKCKFVVVCKCAYVCLILRIRCLGVFLLSKSNKQRKAVSKVEWKHIDISCMSLHVSMCVRWRRDDIIGWVGSRQRSSGQYESRLCHTDADRLHAMLTTELSATGRGLSTGWRCSAKACQICGNLNVSEQQSGKRKVTVAANAGIEFLL